jgi:hypothetical protein
LEGFGIAFRGGDFQGHFRRGTGAAASPSEADEPESNNTNVHVRARSTPPPPVEVVDVFPPLILTFTEEVFFVMPSPKGCELNFWLCFRGLASANSCAEVRSAKRDDPFMRFCFLVVFFGAEACTVAAAFRFMGARAMGSR